MTSIINGAKISKRICEDLSTDVKKLEEIGVVPTLAIVRVGEDKSQIAYEQGAAKRCGTAGVKVKNYILQSEAAEGLLADQIESLNRDDTIHGILLMRPLPRHINEENIRRLIGSEKDVDGITDLSLAGVMTGRKEAFMPCTAQACLEVLDYLNIDLKGKRVAVVGSSLVVGKPVALMLSNRFATVVLCHIYTRDVPTECRTADIIIAAAGCRGLIGKQHVKPGQIVLDVGINLDENGKIHGDVNREVVDGIVEALTPVPGGIGTVTTSVLAKHVVYAACLQCGLEKES